MSLLARWLGLSTARLDPPAAARLAAWQQLANPAPREHDLETGRFVVVDVETTGLNLARDRLVSIAAIAMTGQGIRLGETFEVILRQETASARENILLHGIGGTAQVEGDPPAESLLGFLEFVGKDPLLAFHAAFDAGMIRKAALRHLGFRLRHPWLDLAILAPALFPELGERRRSLDEWSAHFAIPNYARHDAMADSLATAQLGLVVFEAARARGIKTLARLTDLERLQQLRQQSRA